MNNIPYILALETSGRNGSVAIAHGCELLGETFFSGPMKHSREMFPAISELIAKHKITPADISQVHISNGPGSFTGLRIAVSAAKMLNLAQNTKIVAVDTLDAIAQNALAVVSEGCDIAPVLDAKRGQFYLAAYHFSGGKLEKIIPDSLMTPDELIETVKPSSDKPLWVLGEGLLYYKNLFSVPNVNFPEQELWAARASMVHKLGWQLAVNNIFTDPLKLEPNYLRRPDAEEKWQGRKANI